MNKIYKIENRRAHIFVSALAVSILISFNAMAQSDWHVSEAKAKLNNPVQADDASLKEGKALFNTNCKSCHGDPGKNNGLPLVPKPTDMSNAAFLSGNSDGAIFTKITEGKVTMPSFKAVLSETKRWQIVNYIRSFDANRVVEKVVTVVKNAGQNVNAPFQMNVEYNAEANQLTATVLGTTEDGQMAAASNLEVGFFLKRYFGNLPFGEVGGVTNAEGKISADIPTDLPGGEEGKVIAFAKLNDVDAFGDVKAETEVNTKVFHAVNLLDSRSLWTVRVMAPWWLIFTYFGILISVWGTLGYIVIQLFKLKKAGI